MKKIYFFALSIFALSQLNAQTSYTLTQANSEAVVGDSYDTKGIDTTNALPMTVTGTNVNWNVTGISESGVVDSHTFVSAGADPNSSSYPGTTIVQQSTSDTTYFKSTSNKFELLGLNTGAIELNYNSNSAIVAQYPISYGYTNNDLAAGAITAGTVSGTFNATITTVADGTGTLTLGSNNLTGCVRLKTTQHAAFTLNTSPFPASGTIDQTIYNYYNSSSKYPLFQVTYVHIQVPLASIDQHQDQVSMLSTITLGVKDQLKNDAIFKAYPNPATGNVSLHFTLTQNDNYVVEITNTLGQVVKSINYNNLQPGLYNETIDLSGFNAGIYNIKVTGKNSQGAEKLIIE